MSITPGNYTGKNGEANFEADVVAALIKTGWSPDVLRYPTAADLEANFRSILDRNNVARLDGKPLSNDEFGQVMDYIRLRCPTPVAANIFMLGKTVAIKSEQVRTGVSVGDIIYLDVFYPEHVAGGRSSYQIAEQPVYATDAKYNDRRGDVLLLINGLPVISIELKASGVDVNEAVNQIGKYMAEGVYTGLFGLVQVFFAMTPEDAVYFANSGDCVDRAFVFRWADRLNNPIVGWQELIHGKSQILSIPEAHQMASYYMTACTEKDKDGRINDVNQGVLMVARPYQVHAIRAIRRQVKRHSWGTHDPHGGYIWGTTGCGKTLTSYKAGQLVTDLGLADKVVFVVGRVELSDQSYSEYNSFARDGEPMIRTRSTHDLFKRLKDGRIRMLITSIQKLSRVNEDAKYIDGKDIEAINRKRIVFIIDEAHRSQFGDMHEGVERTFANAIFIGFTGTPIFSENAKTAYRDVRDSRTGEVVRVKSTDNTSGNAFGDCLAVYSIADGIQDRNVLGFSPTMVRTFADSALKDAVACEKAGTKSMPDPHADPARYRKYMHYYNLPMKEIEKLLPAAQYNCDEHRQAVVQDIETEFPRLSAGIFHAILATASIPEAFEYYRLFKAHGRLRTTVVVDANVDGNSQGVTVKEQELVAIVDDYNKAYGTSYDRKADPQLKDFKRDVVERLSHKGAYRWLDRSEELDVVIVVNQLLTGFDSKFVNTLYLDREIDTDNLIQAISRTNRVYDNEIKPFGLFRYYRFPYRMEDNIHDALELYCEGDTGCVVVKDIEAHLEDANNIYRAIEKIFRDAEIQDFLRLPPMQEDRQKFRSLFLELTRTINAMKFQGMDRKDDGDPYVQRLLACGKLGGGRAYDVLLMRYKDLAPARGTRGLSRSGYDLPSSLSSVERENIDTEYLEAHFRKFVPDILGDEDEDEKDEKVREFEAHLGALSSDQQETAKRVIRDIRSGDLPVSDRTLRELIAEYQAREEDSVCREFADTYGLDVEDVKAVRNGIGNMDLLIGNMLSKADRKKVSAAFGCGWLSARGKLNAKIREFAGGKEA